MTDLFPNRMVAELFLMKVIASLNDDTLKNGVLFIKDVFAPLVEKKPFTTREEAVNYLMEIINPLSDTRLNNAIIALSGRFVPNLWKKLYPETEATWKGIAGIRAMGWVAADGTAWPPMGDTDRAIAMRESAWPWARVKVTTEVSDAPPQEEEDEFMDEMIDLQILFEEVDTNKPKPEPEPEDEDAKVLRVMKETGLDWEDAWAHIRAEELENGASICCSEECEGHDSAMSVLVEAVRRGKAKRNARRRAEGRLAYLSDSDDEKEEYVAPPRVRDADRHWPYMRCKNIVKALYRYKPNPKDMPRSHHALLEYLASLKKVTLDELKRMSPVEYFTEVDKTRRPGEALTVLVKRVMGKSRW